MHARCPIYFVPCRVLPGRWTCTYVCLGVNLVERGEREVFYLFIFKQNVVLCFSVVVLYPGFILTKIMF